MVRKQATITLPVLASSPPPKSENSPQADAATEVQPTILSSNRAMISAIYGAGGAAANEDTRFRSLCDRLSIDQSLSIAEKLMLAGLGLATDQPEFRLRQPGLKRKRRPEGERKRVGAPKKSATTGDDPKTAPEADLLALIVDDIRAEHPTLKGATVREILHFLKRGNPGVWLPQNAAKIIKKLDAEVRFRFAEGISRPEGPLLRP